MGDWVPPSRFIITDSRRCAHMTKPDAKLRNARSLDKFCVFMGVASLNGTQSSNPMCPLVGEVLLFSLDEKSRQKISHCGASDYISYLRASDGR